MINPLQFSDAVWAGDLATVDEMIAAGANVNAADAPRDPPLHLAVEQQRIDIVRRVIDCGASLDAVSDGGWTLLEHAIDIESDTAWQSHHELGHESTDITKLLLELGAVPTERAIALARDYENYKALALLTEYTHNRRTTRST